MSTKKAPAAAPSATNPSSPALGSASSRGNVTSNGAKAAAQFLSARWKVMEAAANDTSLSASEKPEIYREGKAASTASQGPNQQAKTGGGGGGGGNQAKTGSPWGRRH